MEEEESAEETEDRPQGVGDQGSMVSRQPRRDVSQEMGRCVGQRLEQMWALDLATWRPGQRSVSEWRGQEPVWRGRFLAGGWGASTGKHLESLGGGVSGEDCGDVGRVSVLRWS